MHSRRRFRLLPPKGPNPNTPQVDPNLWIVHYGPAENNDCVPINVIPFNPVTQHMINSRAQVQRAGQIARKEFMLSDRVNWPQIPLPREGRSQPMYAPPPNARGVPQQMAYPPHAPAHPPSKRARHGAAQAQQPPMVGGPGAPAIDSAYDDDEDVTRGDMFDHLTPREVSITRYQQNHEWMEEVVSSAYRMGQIVHADLGLGLKGELAPITEGIFHAQGGDALRFPSKEDAKKTYVGHLDKGLAVEFRKRVDERIESTKAEIAKMEAEHAKMLAKFKASSIVKHAEQELRTAATQDGGESLRLDGRAEDGEDSMGRRSQKHNKSVDEIVSGVESFLGRKAEVVHDVRRIQDGGYQEPVPEPEPMPQPVVAPAKSSSVPSASMSRQPSQADSQNSGIMVGDSDIDMEGTAAGLLDQMHTGLSSNSTPINNFPTPQPQFSAMQSNVATPANLGAPSPHPANPEGEQVPAKSENVAMENAGQAKEGTSTTTGTAPDQGTGSGDWVVVPKGGVSPVPSPGAAAAAPAANASAAAPATTVAEPRPAPAAAASKPPSAVPTPAAGDAESMSFDNNDFSSLGDLDTAGEALAGYDPPTIGATSAGDLGDGLDLNMDMEDSAFGDAFHGVDSGEGGGDMS